MYKHTQSRHTHEKSCGGIVRTEIDLEFEKLKAINLDKEKENLVKKKEILKLKIKLQGDKIDTKTFRAVNKVFIDRSTNNTMNNSNNAISYDIYIVINNNFPNIMSISDGDVPSTIIQLEKRQILDSQTNSLEKMVEIVHCGDHDIFENVVITNLKTNLLTNTTKKKSFLRLIQKLYYWKR